MIPQTDLSCQTENRCSPTLHSQSWQSQMIDAVRCADELCQLLDISPEQVNLSAAAARKFPIMVPRAFVNQMERGNPLDPLLLQVLNLDSEEVKSEGFSADPLNEEAYSPVPGLIHKYHGRVLMIVTGKCAINCRYCFRRSFPYSDNNPSRADWQAAFDYIESDTSLTEVIFSGGDPLSAPDSHLCWLSEQLEQIPHLKRLRIHTRLPVVIPQRICAEFIDWMEKTRLQIQLVLHINHPNEIGDDLQQALRRLRPLGLHTLNQSVLLRGINDDLNTLAKLQEKAYEAGILPYYLHCLDPVEGAAHFDVAKSEARQLITMLRARLPGYLVPRLAVELPGSVSKDVLC